jgi:dTDP-4-amino-4,6-dideoxygalactose transaminase
MASSETIPMLNLQAQYLRLKPEIDAAIQEVLYAANYIQGAAVKSFGKALADYQKIDHVIPCANGTDALQLALMALDLPKGSEIITPGFSYIAVAEVCKLLGYTPVYIDVDARTFNIDVQQLQNAFTAKTKAIIPVHLFGQSADMEPLLTFAKQHGLFVIEDNAQSIGAEYTFSDGRTVKTGCMGDLSTTSFFPSKNLGAYGDAGAVMTNDAHLAERIQQIANHGQIQKYHHQVIGINSRMDTLQAAILSVKLKHLDAFIAERRSVAKAYDIAFEHLQGVQIPFVPSFTTHVYHQYTLSVNHSVAKLRAALSDGGVASMVYYPRPINDNLPYKSQEQLPVAQALCQSVLSLPMGTDMPEAQIQTIINTFKNSLINS